MRTRTVSGVEITEAVQATRHMIGIGVDAVVGRGQPGAGGAFVYDVPQKFENVRIIYSDYADLMSAAPAWAPTKPAEMFNETHLWRFVDLHRARGPALPGTAERTLATAKTAKRAEIRLAARGADYADIVLLTKTFTCDASARLEMAYQMVLARAAVEDSLAFSVVWILADGTTQSLNATQLKSLIRAVDTRSQTIKSSALALLAQIEAAATIEEVDAVSW